MKRVYPLHPLPLIFLFKMARPLQKYLKGRAMPEEDEAFIEALKGVGMPETRARAFLPLVESMRAVTNDRIESYKSDRLYVGGVIALDLIMFQVLTSTTLIDISLSIAWIAFVISLPCAGGFLYVGQIQDENKDYGYGPIHAKLAFLAVIGGTVALAAVVWHFWFVASIALIVVILTVFVISAFCRLFADSVFLEALWKIVEELKRETETPKVIDEQQGMTQ